MMKNPPKLLRVHVDTSPHEIPLDRSFRAPSISIKVASQTNQGMMLRVHVDTSPAAWGTTISAEATWTITKLTSNITFLFDENDYEDEDSALQHLEFFQKKSMLLFNGKDLFDNPSSTLQELGIKDNDRLILFDKRPFMITVSMWKTQDTDKEVEIHDHDTVGSLKEKIESIVGVPAGKQRLCYVDYDCHCVLTDDSAPLKAYGTERGQEHRQPQIWLYTDDDPGMEEPLKVVPSSSTTTSQIEITVKFCDGEWDDCHVFLFQDYDEEEDGQFLYIVVESYYTINQLLRIIRETKPLEDNSNWMLVFQYKNLLEYGSLTLEEMGIQNQDQLQLLQVDKEPFTVRITSSSSSSLEVKTQHTVEVESQWSIHDLKVKIQARTNIHVKKQRMCFVLHGSTDEECHIVLNDDSRTLAFYGIMRYGSEIGLCIEE